MGMAQQLHRIFARTSIFSSALRPLLTHSCKEQGGFDLLPQCGLLPLSRLRARGEAPWMAPALRSEERGRGRRAFARVLPQGTRRFRSPAGARVPSLCWPKEKEPREMAWFNPPTLRARNVEDFGSTPAYAIDDTATPRRIWELRVQSLAARRAALALLLLLLLLLLLPLPLPLASARWERAAFPGPLGGGEAGTRRPRSGRVHGWTRLFDRAGCPAEKPGPASRTCRAGRPASASAGWPSLLVTFLLATQEKGNSAAAGGRNRFLISNTAQLRNRSRCAYAGSGHRQPRP